jgi:hypothetical protein
MIMHTAVLAGDRWRILNEYFGDTVEFIGLARTDLGCRLVISQADAVGEAPQWEQLDELFTVTYGMRRLRIPVDLALGHYEARAYCGGPLGVFDVRPQNCVRTASGIVLPIDVIPRRYRRSEVAQLRRLSF